MAGDPRHLAQGLEIPRENYCDQPYLVRLADGTWVCLLTTGRGVEGQRGQHIIGTRSSDQGRTWSTPVDLEPADGPEASWVVPLLLPSGRICAFYTYNSANLRQVLSDQGPIGRVDTLGDLVMKVSDDGGRSWSAERWPVPVREFAIDRENPYGGRVRFFWGVGKPHLADGRALLGLSKVGGFGVGFMTRSEGFFMRSDNLATESDPARVEWLTLPDGDVGLRAPVGPIAEEHNLVHLGGPHLYCTYRTIDGHPCAAYSHDWGHSWTPPSYLAYTPGGRLVKHPRAANFVRRFSGGKLLYWFHNHGGRWYEDRNPAWLCGGEIRDGQVHWSQPEIALYDDDPAVRMSYPDFLEEPDGTIFVTETQKTVARVHRLEAALVRGLWSADTALVARDGLVLELAGEALKPGATAVAPKLPELAARAGFSLDLWLKLDDLGAGQCLLDSRDGSGAGLRLLTTDRGAVALVLSDGRTTAFWDCDAGLLTAGAWHHVAAIVDGGPKIITFVVDGALGDGGAQRQFGWGRFSPYLRAPNGAATMLLAPSLRGALGQLRIYDRALRTAEAVGNWRAGS